MLVIHQNPHPKTNIFYIFLHNYNMLYDAKSTFKMGIHFHFLEENYLLLGTSQFIFNLHSIV